MDTVLQRDGCRRAAELYPSDVLVSPGGVATLADLPFHLLQVFPDKVLMKRPVSGTDVSLTGSAIFEQVREVSLGLTRLGVSSGDRVAIIAESRPEWVITDLAALCAGAATVPLYPTQSLAQMEFVLRDSGARAVVVSSGAHLEKIRKMRSRLPDVDLVVVMDPLPAGGPAPADALPLAEVADHGRALLESNPERGQHFHYGVLARDEHETATIVYTMDESGVLKGAVLSHANLLANVRATEEVLPLNDSDVALSLLPLSHVFERMALYRYLRDGVQVVFVESLMTVMRDLKRVRPTVMTGVPRVYEKFLSAVEEELARASRLRRTVVRAALAIGRTRADLLAAGGRPGIGLRMAHAVADRLVLSRVRHGVGGRLRCLVSGSAALPGRVDEFFASIGLPIYEGYGLTETSPVLTTNGPRQTRRGTVGQPLPGVEIRIAEGGEIQARGPNVTAGYLNRRDLNEMSFDNGWFRTGDIGEIDADGYLTITDRKKDLIVTAGGKKLAPSPLEAVLMADLLVADAILVGENRKFVSALIVPDFARLDAHLASKGMPPGAPDELRLRADVQQLYQKLVDRLNLGLGQFERIKRLALLPSGVRLDRAPGPTTLLQRRRAIERAWQPVVDRLYAAGSRD